MKREKGFTIAELSIAIGVFALLSTVMVAVINPVKRIGQANDAKRSEDLQVLSKAIELYQIDNGELPEDLSTANVWNGQKVVLCSSAAELTCDGQTRDCLVVDDGDFLSKYVGELPVDPQKDDTSDTGYYITRTGNDAMTFGACGAYQEEEVTKVVKAALPEYISTCGDGEATGDEICDSNLTESCFDDITQQTYYAGGYDSDKTGECSGEMILCNATCDACLPACAQNAGDGGEEGGDEPTPPAPPGKDGPTPANPFMP